MREGRRSSRRRDALKRGGYMKILKGLTVVTAVVLALAAQGSAAGEAMTSDYTVPSTTGETRSEHGACA